MLPEERTRGRCPKNVDSKFRRCWPLGFAASGRHKESTIHVLNSVDRNVSVLFETAGSPDLTVDRAGFKVVVFKFRSMAE